MFLYPPIPVFSLHSLTRKRNALGVARILSRTEEADGTPQNTIFHELRDSDVLPPSEKTLERLQDEGNILIGAGSETTANALAVLFCHVLLNENIEERLREELWSLSDEDAEDWLSLEKLPYLVSVQFFDLFYFFQISFRWRRCGVKFGSELESSGILTSTRLQLSTKLSG
jgi:hypothetical protein